MENSNNTLYDAVMPSHHPNATIFRNRARHVTCASRFRSVTVFIAIFTSWFRQRRRFISHPMQNSVWARARHDRRNIYLAIRTCNNSGYSAVRADRRTASSIRLYSLPLVWFPPEYFTPMTYHPLPFCTSFSINRVSNELKKNRC